MFPLPTYPRVGLVHQSFSRRGKQEGRGLEAGMTLALKAGCFLLAGELGEGQLKDNTYSACTSFATSGESPYPAPFPSWVQPSGQARVHEEINDILIPRGRREWGRDPRSTKGDLPCSGLQKAPSLMTFIGSLGLQPSLDKNAK